MDLGVKETPSITGAKRSIEEMENIFLELAERRYPAFKLDGCLRLPKAPGQSASEYHDTWSRELETLIEAISKDKFDYKPSPKIDLETPPICSPRMTPSQAPDCTSHCENLMDSQYVFSEHHRRSRKLCILCTRFDPSIRFEGKNLLNLHYNAPASNIPVAPSAFCHEVRRTSFNWLASGTEEQTPGAPFSAEQMVPEMHSGEILVLTSPRNVKNLASARVYTLDIRPSDSLCNMGATAAPQDVLVPRAKRTKYSQMPFDMDFTARPPATVVTPCGSTEYCIFCDQQLWWEHQRKCLRHLEQQQMRDAEAASAWDLMMGSGGFAASRMHQSRPQGTMEVQCPPMSENNSGKTPNPSSPTVTQIGGGLNETYGSAWFGRAEAGTPSCLAMFGMEC